MSLILNTDAIAGGTPVTMLPAGEGKYFLSQVFTVGTVSIRVNFTLLGSRQINKDGTRRGMIRTQFEIPLIGISPTGDPTKVASPAQNSIHSVIALDPRVAQLLDTPQYSELIMKPIMLAAAINALVSLGGTTCVIGSRTSAGRYDVTNLVRVIRGMSPFVDDETIGGTDPCTID